MALNTAPMTAADVRAMPLPELRALHKACLVTVPRKNVKRETIEVKVIAELKLK
jgi:hypothetical protein